MFLSSAFYLDFCFESTVLERAKRSFWPQGHSIFVAEWGEGQRSQDTEVQCGEAKAGPAHCSAP